MWLDVAEKLLEECYKYAEKEMPDWIKKRYKSKTFTDFKEEIKELIIGVMLKDINEAYSRNVRGSGVYYSENPLENLENRIKIVGENYWCDWYFVKKDSKTGEDTVYICYLLEEKLREKLKMNFKLKSIAQLFGWRYELITVKFKGEASRKNYAIVSLKDFVKLFGPEIEQSNEQSQNST